MKMLLLSLAGLVLAGLLPAQPAQKTKPAASVTAVDRKTQLIAQTKQRIAQIDVVLKTVKWEPAKNQGPALSAQARKVDAEHDAWLAGVRGRLEKLRNEMQFGTTPMGEDVVEKLTQMNLQFLALQEATQMESRKFQTLSNASKARHDIALNAIRNMK
jgi:hypothetical protein